MGELLVSDKKNILDPNMVSFKEREKQIKEDEKREQEQLKREKNSPFNSFRHLGQMFLPL